MNSIEDVLGAEELVCDVTDCYSQIQEAEYITRENYYFTPLGIEPGASHLPGMVEPHSSPSLGDSRQGLVAGLSDSLA